MRSVNKVILIGHLGAEPELRYTPSGRPVCNLSLATNQVWIDAQGARQERTHWHRVVAWGKQGQACHGHLKKGRPVYVEGRLETSSYEKEGVKRYRSEIVSDTIVFLDGRQGREPEAPSADGPLEELPF